MPHTQVEGRLGLEKAITEAAARMWIGVPIFFVISGYCISASADSKRRQRGGVGQYFLRRFRRIYPPCAILLFLTCFLVVLIDCVLLPRALTGQGAFFRPWWLNSWQWIGNLTLTETWRYHFVGGQKALYLGHYWTLCYEEQFYAVMGLLLLLAPRRFFSGTILVTIVTAIAAIVGPRIGLDIRGFFFSGPWLMFAAGIAVYYHINYASPWQKSILSVMLLLGMCVPFAYPSELMAVDKNYLQQSFCASVFALIVLLLHPVDGAISRAKWMQPLMWLGMISYSLYLVHMPVIQFVSGLGAAGGVQIGQWSPFLSIPFYAAISIPIAYLFHRWVEVRFMNFVSRSPVPSPTGQNLAARTGGGISIVIPTYNGARFIRDAVASACRQTRQPIEVLVVDDASSDRTVEIVEQMAAEMPVPVRVLHMPANSGGPVAPMNLGVEHAQGDLIAFLDQDDCMEPTKLERLGALLERYPDTGLAFGQQRDIDTAGNQQPIHEKWYRRFPSTDSRLEADDELRRLISDGYYYGGAGGTMIRKSAWEAVGGFRPQFRITWDHDFALRATMRGFAVGYAADIVFQHRLHGNNLQYRDGGLLHYREKGALWLTVLPIRICRSDSARRLVW